MIETNVASISESDPMFKSFMEIEKRNYNKFGYPKIMMDIKNRSFINHLVYKLKKFEGKMDRKSAAEIKKINYEIKMSNKGKV